MVSLSKKKKIKSMQYFVQICVQKGGRSLYSIFCDNRLGYQINCFKRIILVYVGRVVLLFYVFAVHVYKSINQMNQQIVVYQDKLYNTWAITSQMYDSIIETRINVQNLRQEIASMLMINEQV